MHIYVLFSQQQYIGVNNLRVFRIFRFVKIIVFASSLLHHFYSLCFDRIANCHNTALGSATLARAQGEANCAHAVTDMRYNIQYTKLMKRYTICTHLLHLRKFLNF
jgi:hypothetical protein